MRTRKNCKMYIMNKPQFGNAVTPTRSQTDGRREVPNRIVTQLYSTRRAARWTAARYETNSQLGNQIWSRPNRKVYYKLAQRLSTSTWHVPSYYTHFSYNDYSSNWHWPGTELPYIAYRKIGHVGRGRGVRRACATQENLFPSKFGR